MNTLKHSEQTSVPANQPTGWPRLYLIPETITIPPQQSAINDHAYHGHTPAVLPTREENRIQKYIRIEKEIFQEACADAWAALKQAGRDTVRWFTRWVILPMALASMFWIQLGNPAELPL